MSAAQWHTRVARHPDYPRRVSKPLRPVSLRAVRTVVTDLTTNTGRWTRPVRHGDPPDSSRRTHDRTQALPRRATARRRTPVGVRALITLRRCRRCLVVAAAGAGRLVGGLRGTAGTSWSTGTSTGSSVVRAAPVEVVTRTIPAASSRGHASSGAGPLQPVRRPRDATSRCSTTRSPGAPNPRGHHRRPPDARVGEQGAPAPGAHA